MDTLHAAESATYDEMRSIYSGSERQLESALAGVSALVSRLSPSSLSPRESVRASSPATVVGGGARSPSRGTRRQLFGGEAPPRTLSARLAGRGVGPLQDARAAVRSPWPALSPRPFSLANPSGTEDALEAMLAHAQEVSRRCRGLNSRRSFLPHKWDRCEKPPPSTRDRLAEYRKQLEAESRAAASAAERRRLEEKEEARGRRLEAERLQAEQDALAAAEAARLAALEKKKRVPGYLQDTVSSRKKKQEEAAAAEAAQVAALEAARRKKEQEAVRLKAEAQAAEAVRLEALAKARHRAQQEEEAAGSAAIEMARRKAEQNAMATAEAARLAEIEDAQRIAAESEAARLRAEQEV
eukprot:COSAG05_NODE_5587_length_1135_cov_1.240347_1_plen_354_part_01